MTTINRPTTLQFNNRFVDGLPADSSDAVHPRQVFGAAYSFVNPTPVSNPEMVAYSREVAARLGFDDAFMKSAEFIQIFSGNQPADGMRPFAMAYGGHQFGNWAGQLGDGRAINLGELVNPQGEHWMLQLKGAGRTPYSRRGDGLAVLRSSIREFLCSEAMHHLGVPTTRALSLVTTGEQVLRDMFYDGNAAYEKGAIVARVAPSFTRFGNFQLPASRGDQDLLKQLVDHTIRADFPHLGEPSADTYAAWFNEVAERTCDMIIEWMRVGFVHGVMNTDNLSILGLTIDYGPYGWLDDYDPNWTPNTTDAGQKRYRFGYQPQIAHWNLVQLANTLVPLFEDAAPLQAAIDAYPERFRSGYLTMMAQKIGVSGAEPSTQSELVEAVQRLLTLTETDMTIFFRNLADVPLEPDVTDEALLAPLLDAYYLPEQLAGEVREQKVAWLRSLQQVVLNGGWESAERKRSMNRVNPKYVLRNYLAQLAIDKSENDDHSLVWELLELLRHPYDEQPEMEKYFVKRPDWARSRPGCSMLSCSS